MLGLLTRRHLALCVGIVSVGLLIGGCSDGKDGKDGVSTAMVSGTVTNTGNNNAPVAGAVVMTDPAVPGVILVTDLAGDYSGELPIGAYRLMVEETNYEDAEETISVVAGVDQDVDFGLVPVADVVTEINNAPAVSPLPGGSFPLTATVTPMNGTTVASYAWTQSASVTAGIANPASQTCTVTLGSAAAYKAELLTHLDILDRWIVQGVNPWSLEEAGHVAFQCVVTMSDASTHTVSVDIHTDMSGIASWSPGLRTVPTGSAVLITGGEQPAYTWTFTRPGGSAATLMETNTRHPYFTPDVDGLYSLNETNSGET
ncbi:MAG: carboxypeptidase-like regulatory domain-containing protein, partial [Planctomycetota bacterium]